MEISNALLWIAAAIRFDVLEERAFVAIAASVLLALSIIDLEHRRLPNAIVLPAAVGFLVWVLVTALLRESVAILGMAVVSGLAAFVLMLTIAVVSGGMGFGDVKLAALVGVVSGRFGWPVSVGAIFGAFFLGGIIAITLLATGRRGRKDAVPFGPALAAGAVLGMFVGETPVRIWLGF